MRERKDFSEYNVLLEAVIVVNSTRRARNFNGEIIEPISVNPFRNILKETREKNIESVKTELFGQSENNPVEAEIQQRRDEQKIHSLIPDQPLYLTEIENIVNNGFEIDQGNSLK